MELVVKQTSLLTDLHCFLPLRGVKSVGSSVFSSVCYFLRLLFQTSVLIKTPLIHSAGVAFLSDTF